MTAKLVQFPNINISNIPDTLRSLADRIESGDYGEALNLAWVLDRGAAHAEVGMIGASARPGAEAHLLFAMGQRKLEML